MGCTQSNGAFGCNRKKRQGSPNGKSDKIYIPTKKNPSNSDLNITGQDSLMGLNESAKFSSSSQ